MQADAESTRTPLELLEELEARVTRSSALEREWQAAFAAFPASGGPGALHRFREWFLLERPAEALGAPPVVAWSPEAPAAGSSWARLLDNHLGIFRLIGLGPDGAWILEDLWSARTLVWREQAGQEPPGPEALVVGRFVAAPDGSHEALPGVFLVESPGLVQAALADLAGLRAENPRRRLSQLECERLFQPLHAARDAVGEAVLEPEEARRIWTRLAGPDDPPAAAIEEELRLAGPSALLDRLAFDTDLDLERLRRLLPAWAAGLERRSAAAGDRSDGGDEDTWDAAAALERFDRSRRAGMSAEEALRRLETDLGFAAGETAERPDPEPFGPVGRPAPSILFQSYRWEREATGGGLTPAEDRCLADLEAFLARVAAGNQDRPLPPHQIAAFLLGAGTAEPGGLRRSLGLLRPFLAWAEREQQEPLTELNAGLDGELGRRLERAAACNRALAGSAATASARLAKVGPLQVQAEDGELLPVEGIPDDCVAELRVGDLVRGVWKGGRFRAAAWIPAEALGPQAG